jgi:folate-binding protein YgfZ
MCLQSMLTHDLVGPGARSFRYGAALTPKGMIVSDLWSARQGEEVALYAPAAGKAPLLEIFQRSLPPRLARCEDRSSGRSVMRLVGPEAVDRARATGFAVPEPGQSLAQDVAGARCLLGRPSFGMPFELQIECAGEDRETVRAALEARGVLRATVALLEHARVLSGWPRLGAEIDDKTLPQEVRFDELEAVSYTKGCYTGQETVARVHFRGHANRWLAGLSWDDAPDPEHPEILLGKKSVGRVSSVTWVPLLGRHLGLGVVRRDVTADALVTAAGHSATVSNLPFDVA